MASFVKVARFANGFQAHLVVGRLETLGIPAVAVDDHVEGNPAGTLLWVPEADAERALRAIEEGVPDADEEGAAVPKGPGAAVAFAASPKPARPSAATASCPSCGSSEVDLLPRLLPFLPPRRRCLRCRTTLP